MIKLILKSIVIGLSASALIPMAVYYLQVAILQYLAIAALIAVIYFMVNRNK